jgi:oligoendopeptidase F
MKIERPPRKFVAPDLEIKGWEDIRGYFENLLNREGESLEDFKTWLKDRSELDAVLEEEQAWRYIRMSIDTQNEELRTAYNDFVSKIQPEIAPLDHALNVKMLENPWLETLKEEESYALYFRALEVQKSLFRDENVSLEAELSEQAQQYGALSGAQTIEHEGKNLTMQQAAQFLKNQDASLREEVFTKMAARRREDVVALNDLYSDLIKKRHQLAINAGFENFRDYKFQALGRFDYTKQDCFAFHDAIKTLVVPIVKEIQQNRLSKLGKDKFKPWDTEVDPEGKAPLQPFQSGAEMLDGTIEMLSTLDPYFGDCLQTMKEMGHLDLESKNGKAPGGYNYPLYETGVPFIFMNAVGAQRDLETMVHEAGHAIHSFLSRDLELTGFKNVPSEVAELASMSMELISMTEWGKFYKDAETLKRAIKEQLEGVLKVLPWIAQIDAFQHWIYENPSHSVEERYEKWRSLSADFGTGLVDWTGFEDQVATSWQRQLHLFEVPFYYIEYGIAQLGALGVWMNAKQNHDKAINDYKAALKLGYTRSIPDIYATAGVKFDFSASHLRSLIDFVKLELDLLNS